MNIAIDPVKISGAYSSNAGTYKLYHDIDSPKTFDKGYLGAIVIDETGSGYQYSGNEVLNDFELKQLEQFIRNYHATGIEFDDHNRDITSK